MSDTHLLQTLNEHRNDIDEFGRVVEATEDRRKILLASQELRKCAMAIDACRMALARKDSAQASGLKTAADNNLRSLENLLCKLADYFERC